MLTVGRQRAALAGVLFVLCIVIALDLSLDRFGVREGLSAQERKASCETEADNWAGSTDLGTTEKTTVDAYKASYTKQCEQVGLKKEAEELYGRGKAMNALYNNSYAKQLVQTEKENAVNQLVGNFLMLGAEMGRVQTSDKPAAVSVRNYAALLEYIDVIEKNSSSTSAGSLNEPSQPTSEKSGSSGIGF